MSNARDPLPRKRCPSNPGKKGSPMIGWALLQKGDGPLPQQGAFQYRVQPNRADYEGFSLSVGSRGVH